MNFNFLTFLLLFFSVVSLPVSSADEDQVNGQSKPSATEAQNQPVKPAQTNDKISDLENQQNTVDALNEQQHTASQAIKANQSEQQKEEQSGNEIDLSDEQLSDDSALEKAENFVNEQLKIEPKVQEKKVKGVSLTEQMSIDEKVILEYLDQLKQMNKKMSGTEDEKTIDQMLGEKNKILDGLVRMLGTATIDELSTPEDFEHKSFLNSRISVNEERGNDLAIKRDKIKLAYYKIVDDTLAYLQYLINASRSYTVVDEIVSESVTRLSAARKNYKEYKLPDYDSSSKVYSELKKNSAELNRAYEAYRGILSFIINNPGKIATTHWFQKVSLLSTISFFNNFEFIRPISHKLAPFRVDAGGIIVSLIIIMLVVFCYPLAVKGISWLVEKYFLNNEDEHNEEIYHQLKRPVFALIVFFSLDLATYALLYKTQYKSSLDNFVFIVYAFLYLWIIFKVMDSVVVLQLDKFSKANKELRKELVNLGIQITKGLFIIIALSLLLNRFGISITALMSTLGIGGLAFALAAKDSLSNLLGGVTLLIDNVFSLGDWVKIGEVEGTAVQIGLRSTTIRTFDNALITIPNSVISVSSVRNWNRRAIGRRIKMYVGVTYESNMDDIRQALEDIKKMLIEHKGIANSKEKFGDKRKQFRFTSRADMQGIKSTQMVYLDRFNDFSIDILIYCFSRSVDWAEWLEVKQDVLFKIAEIVKKNNLEFAYPTAVRIYKSDQDEAIEEPSINFSKVDRLA